MHYSKILFTVSLLTILSTSQFAFAASDETLEFATSLEETLGHFWAIELNLDEDNAELALVHATHPIAELYDSMRPVIQNVDPTLDDKFRTILLELKDKATTDVSRSQAQQAVDEAKDVVYELRDAVVGNQQSDDPNFKLILIKNLLQISVVEYTEAISDGVIVEVAEFQDGSAFVWRSQQIFNEIESDVDSTTAQDIEESYTELWALYDNLEDPVKVKSVVDRITSHINNITGESDTDLLEYVTTINMLLVDVKSEYRQGNTELALSYATKAYLDNFEFLESSLVEAGERELMEELEDMMRVELRDMIKQGAPASQVDAQVDAILEKMDVVAVIVPEFGSAVMIVLLVAIVSIVLLQTRFKSGQLLKI